MADTLLRLKVDSKEYDDKLKRATEGIQRYVQKCREVGGTLEHVDQGVEEFVRGLGQMETVAQGGTQGLREMTRSITDLTIQYRSLTDEEKQSPFGQAMAASLQQLTQRAATVRDAMTDVNNAINRSASDTRVFDQIAGSVGLATAGFQTFQGAAKLLGIEMNNNVEVIAKLQAAMAITNGLTQIQTALQKESALMQGVAAVQTQANAVAQALLAKNTKMATIAGEAFNAVAKSNPYVLIASAVIAAGTALIAFSKHNREATDAVKVNEDAMKRAESAANAYKNSMTSTYADLMSKYDGLSRAWRTLADTHQKQEWINNNQKAFQDLGISINNIADAENVFEKNTAAVVSGFKRRAEAAAIAARMVEMYKQKIEMEQQRDELIQQNKAIAYHTRIYPTKDSRFVPDAEADQYGRTTYNEGRYTRNGDAFVFTPKGAEEYNKTLASTVPELKKLKEEYQSNNKEIEKWNNRLSELEKGIKPTGGTTVTTTSTPVEIVYPTGSLADLTQKLQELKTAQSQALDNSDWIKYQQQIEQVQYQIDALKGTWKDGLQATFTINADDTEALSKLGEIEGVTIADKTATVHADTVEAYNEIIQLTRNIEGTTVTFSVKPEIDRNIGRSITNSAGLSDFISSIKKQLQEADFGSDLYQSLTDKLADATMLQNLVKESLSVGLGTALFDIADETGQDFWDRVLSPEGVENADWQAIADVINQKRKELGLDAITIDVNTGKVAASKGSKAGIDDTEAQLKATNQLIGGLSQVSTGLNQMGLKIPEEVQNFISIAQGLMSVIQGVQSIIQVFGTTATTAQVSALSANTAALIANTAAQAASATTQGAEAAMDVIKIAAVAAMAHGGIIHAAHGYAVPGNHYSGDTTPILANAGELVLNRAQQGNLASQLESKETASESSSKSFVSGQDIFLGTNNYLKSTGQGEIVTTKMLRQMGIA